MKESILYWRDKGNIAYQTRLFELSEIEQLVDQLLSSNLDWYWESERNKEPDEESLELQLPKWRLLTSLDKITASVFLSDLKEHDIDTDGRYILMIGLIPGTSTDLIKGENRQCAIDEFRQQEAGPIKMMIYRGCDFRKEFIFVSHDPIQPVLQLLNQWGLSPSLVNKHKSLFRRWFDSLTHDWLDSIQYRWLDSLRLLPDDCDTETGRCRD